MKAGFDMPRMDDPPWYEMKIWFRVLWDCKVKHGQVVKAKVVSCTLQTYPPYGPEERN